jgi:hypothetical protein
MIVNPLETSLYMIRALKAGLIGYGFTFTDQQAAEPVAVNLPDIKTVGSASLLVGARDMTPDLPAVFVLAGEGAPDQWGVDKTVVREAQRWQVSVCVNNPNTAGELTGEVIAGAYLARIIEILSGWSPPNSCRKMAYKGRAEALYQTGYVEIQADFELSAILAQESA